MITRTLKLDTKNLNCDKKTRKTTYECEDCGLMFHSTICTCVVEFEGFDTVENSSKSDTYVLEKSPHPRYHALQPLLKSLYLCSRDVFVKKCEHWYSRVVFL